MFKWLKKNIVLTSGQNENLSEDFEIIEKSFVIQASSRQETSEERVINSTIATEIVQPGEQREKNS